MKFEWDEEKEQNNIKKHKIDFSIAARIFFDKALFGIVGLGGKK